MVKFYFNDQLVDNPLEWRELSVVIKYNHENQMSLLEYDQTLTFTGDAFEYLYSRKFDNCQLIRVRVEMECSGSFTTIMNGNIFITDCSFNELNCECSVPIQDDGFSSRVQNNKNIPVSLLNDKTKNGEPITPAANYPVLLFDPRDGINYFPRQLFSIFECFKFIVSYMTDNTVEFESNYFENGDGQYSAILSGYDLRNGDLFVNNVEQYPEMTFENLYNFARRTHNVALGFRRDVNNRPVMIIEHITFFRTSPVAVQLNDVNETELDFVQELLYSKISVGSNIINQWQCDDGNSECTAANNLIYFGFENEEFGFTGECNNDTNLDLSIPSSFVVDPNTIEDVLIYDNQNFDRSNFVIRWEFNPSPFRHAVQTDVLGIGAYWYNNYYSNKSIIERYSDYLFGALVLYGLQVNVQLFKVDGNISSGLLSPDQFPIQFNWQPDFTNTIFDVDGVYQLSPTNEFRPINDGIYKLYAGVQLYRDSSSDQDNSLIVSGYFILEQFNSSGTLIATHNSLLQFNFLTTGSNPFFIEREFDWITMEAGDYLVFSVEYWQNRNPAVYQAVIEFSRTENHYLECRESRVIIKDDIPQNGAERRIIRTTTNEIPVEYESIKPYFDDTTKRIALTNQRINRKGWTDQIRHNFVTGTTDISILTD